MRHISRLINFLSVRKAFCLDNKEIFLLNKRLINAAGRLCDMVIPIFSLKVDQMFTYFYNQHFDFNGQLPYNKNGDFWLSFG